MPVSKKRNFARKTEKTYQFVTFETELFEGEFSFPKFEHLPIRVVEALNTGDLQVATGWLRDAKVDPDQIEAFRDLDATELHDFISDWQKGQPVTLPKSSN